MAYSDDMISINGIWLPTPDGLDITLNPLDKYTSERNPQTGILYREMVGKYWQFDIHWTYAENVERMNKIWNTLMATSEYFDVNLPLPTGERKTINCYHAPLKVSMRSYWSIGQQKVADWLNISTSLIDTGRSGH